MKLNCPTKGNKFTRDALGPIFHNFADNFAN